MSLTQVSRYFEEQGLAVTRAPTIAGASGAQHAPALLCEGPADAWTLVFNSARAVRAADVVDAHVAALDCDARAVLVSTGGYSEDARRWATRFGVALLDWADVRDADVEAAQRTEEAIAAADAEALPDPFVPTATAEIPIETIGVDPLIVDVPLLAEAFAFEETVATEGTLEPEEVPFEAIPFPIEDVEVENPFDRAPVPSLEFALPEDAEAMLAFTWPEASPEPAMAEASEAFYADLFLAMESDGPVVEAPIASAEPVAHEPLVDATLAEAPAVVVEMDVVPESEAAPEEVEIAAVPETPVVTLALVEPPSEPVTFEPVAVDVAPAAPESPLPWRIAPREAAPETTVLLATGAAFLTGSASRLADLRKSLEDTGANSFGEHADVDMEGGSLWLKKLQKKDEGSDLL